VTLRYFMKIPGLPKYVEVKDLKEAVDKVAEMNPKPWYATYQNQTHRLAYWDIDQWYIPYIFPKIVYE